MADAGIGEAALLTEVVGGSSAAAEGGGMLASLGGATGGSFIPAAGMDAGLFSVVPEATYGVGAGLGAMSQYAPEFMSEAGMMGPQYAPQYMGEYGGPQVGSTEAIASNTATPTDLSAANQTLKNPMTSPEFMKDPLGWMMNNKAKTAMAGAGIYTLANALKGGALTKQNSLPPYTPPSATSYGLGRTMASNYAPQRNAIYNRGYADGGTVNSLNIGPGSVASGGVAPKTLLSQAPSGIQTLASQYGISPQDLQQGMQTLKGLGIGHAAGGLMSSPPTPGLMDNGQSGNVDFMGGDMYPMSQQNRSYYATPTQAPTSAQQAMASYEPKTNPLTGEPTAHMAAGGITSLGSYSDGGRMLKGPGDGMSDNIPATINGKQPARLADGEFVVPADVVSHLGNGSTDAGAKQLYSMLDKVRKARTGTKKQGKEINPQKYLKA